MEVGIIIAEDGDVIRMMCNWKRKISTLQLPTSGKLHDRQCTSGHTVTDINRRHIPVLAVTTWSNDSESTLWP